MRANKQHTLVPFIEKAETRWDDDYKITEGMTVNLDLAACMLSMVRRVPNKNSVVRSLSQHLFVQPQAFSPEG